MERSVYFVVSEESKHKVLRILKNASIKSKVITVIRQVPLSFDVNKILSERFDWIIFTSPFGAKLFLKKALEKGAFQYMIDTKFAAVGSETAKAMQRFGLQPDFLPREYTTISLANTIPITHFNKVLTVRAQEGDNELEEILKQRGAIVTRINVYRQAQRRKKIRGINAGDIVVFGSKNEAKIFVSLLHGVKPTDLYALPLGPRVQEELKKLNFTLLPLPKVYTFEGALRELEATLSGL